MILALIAALGVGRMFDARQDYEDELAASYGVESAAAGLFAAGQVEQATDGVGADATTRRRARAAFDAAASVARGRAAGDPRSRALVRRAVVVRARDAGQVATALTVRQRARREAARHRTSDRTRSALLLAAGAGLLALLGAFALVAAITASIRGPLDRLVSASRRLAGGDLDSRVEPAGPAELRELHGAFNEMAEGLQAAQARLEAERGRLAVTIESLGDGLVVCDAGGNVASLNPRARELAPSLTVGETAASPLPPLERGIAGDIEVRAGERTLSVTAGRLPGGEGEAGGVVWTLRDISDRARIEAMKTEFVATASHELRSPLTSIKGFIALLGRSDALGPREREFVDVVLESTDRLVELVNDLLDIARLEAGRLELAVRPVGVAELVEGMATELRPRFEAAGSRLVLDLARDLSPVHADPVRLRQILDNLVINALGHTAQGARVTVTGDADGDEVVLAVADEGAGMAPEEVGRVFERFVRHGDGGGQATGLGLSLARSLTALHGGEIDVRSRVGEGTVFSVRLPALDRAET